MRLAVVYPFGNFETVPSLVALLSMAQRLSVDVDVLSPENDLNVPLSAYGDRIRHIRVPERALAFPERLSRTWLGAARGAARAARLGLDARRARAALLADLQREASVEGYKCLIGVDPESLPLAATIARNLHIPLVFWSLEIVVGGARSGRAGWLRHHELDTTQRAVLWVSQDAWRASLLAGANNLDVSKALYVPNAPLGIARRHRDASVRGDLGIPPNATVAVNAGTIRWFACSLELSRAASRWPAGFCLLNHSRQMEYSFGKSYVDQVVECTDNKRVFTSFESRSASEYRTVLDNADVGLALYDAVAPRSDGSTGANMAVMGYSSGKLASYLFNGLPVVVSHSTGPRDLVEAFECGVVVQSVAEVGDALQLIADDYDRYSRNALRCYEVALNPESSLRTLLARVSEL